MLITQRRTFAQASARARELERLAAELGRRIAAFRLDEATPEADRATPGVAEEIPPAASREAGAAAIR
ncbi:MAG: hypothetical protein K6U79_09620 [Firmicutes bacterium]|nr:hypothetical protein [Bacillota bacterium]